jgi:hypothetical protein
MKDAIITTTSDIVDAVEEAVREKDILITDFLSRAGLSSSYLYALRSGRTQSIGSESLLNMIKALGLRLVIEDPAEITKRASICGSWVPAAPTTPFVEDIRIDQNYGWVPDGMDGVRWGMTTYNVMIKRNGEWTKVPVNHINSRPPKDGD